MLGLPMKPAMIALPLPLTLILVLGAATTGDKTKISGTFALAYATQQAVAVGDFEGHALVLGEAKGSNRSTGQTDFMDGAEVTNAEMGDLVQGNGPHHGYITFSKNGASTIAKWSGNVTTTLSPENTPMTTFEGTWTYVKGTGSFQGITGSGTYKGRFTSQTEYTVDWKGEYSE